MLYDKCFEKLIAKLYNETIFNFCKKRMVAYLER